jgi:hypothetical protein
VTVEPPRTRPRTSSAGVAAVAVAGLIGLQVLDSPKGPPEPPPPVWIGTPRGPEGSAEPAGSPPPRRRRDLKLEAPLPVPFDDPALGNWECRHDPVPESWQRVTLSSLGLVSFEGESTRHSWNCNGVWNPEGLGRYRASLICHVLSDTNRVFDVPLDRMQLAILPDGELTVSAEDFQWRCRPRDER